VHTGDVAHDLISDGSTMSQSARQYTVSAEYKIFGSRTIVIPTDLLIIPNIQWTAAQLAFILPLNTYLPDTSSYGQPSSWRHSQGNPYSILMTIPLAQNNTLQDLLARDASISQALREEAETLPDIILTEVSLWVTHATVSLPPPSSVNYVTSN
jgi:hypothetical protein